MKVFVLFLSSLITIIYILVIFSNEANCLSTNSRRMGRTIFHEDQDVLVILMVVFPYYFPLWERFVNTSTNLGFEAAVAEFPNIPEGGLPSCGVLCRKKRSEARKESSRFFNFDEQIVYFIMELIAAYSVPIIPNPYAEANKRPFRLKKSELFFTDRSQDSKRLQRNLCINNDFNFQSSRNFKENCFKSDENSFGLSAYETAFIDSKGQSTLQINPSTVISAISCHFTEWFLKNKVHFIIKNICFNAIKTICSNNYFLNIKLFQKYCNCLKIKKLI